MKYKTLNIQCLYLCITALCTLYQVSIIIYAFVKNTYRNIGVRTDAAGCAIVAPDKTGWAR